ncbi:TlpA disulfide reductase family protein [Mucilaginibacter terrae]|uniref:Thiol-disulfide isomerase/thioredoxin n=1 Tax=Mucilaginibacter terrae TaxID=1955052 RepID=A0ABU3GRJ9_9SPHI|nr:TlpA disulfide reductase family protein [Mucilaginibacter terrae]MDT3402391.1 thiol-disulfide isomerase/thioredoxin [Mucilaginibacter terrae]
MKKYFLLFAAACLFSISAFAQVQKITLLQLQKRISNPDTVYLVNFWATWCKPCIAELPHFEKLQAAYKNQPLKVLLVSMDFESKFPDVIKFAKTRGLRSEVYLAVRKNDQELIDAIDKEWSGALPGTLIVNGKKGIRKFQEQEFTYEELNKFYQTNK